MEKEKKMHREIKRWIIGLTNFITLKIFRDTH